MCGLRRAPTRDVQPAAAAACAVLRAQILLFFRRSNELSKDVASKFLFRPDSYNEAKERRILDPAAESLSQKGGKLPITQHFKGIGFLYTVTP